MGNDSLEKSGQTKKPPLITILIVAIVVLICVKSLIHENSDSTDATVAASTSAPSVEQPASEETTAPAPAIDRHKSRSIAQAYWRRIITKAALSEGLLQAAKDAMSNNNLADASRYIERARSTTMDASNIAGDDVPQGWDDVKEHLQYAMAGFSQSYGKMHEALDSDKPSDMAAAADDADAARSEMSQAVHLARVHYVGMGGKWSDVSDGTAEAAAMSVIVHSQHGSAPG